MKKLHNFEFIKNENFFFNEILELFLNSIFIFTFLLVLRFKKEINFISSNDSVYKEKIKNLVNLNFFKEIQENNKIIKKFYQEFFSNKKNIEPIKNFFDLYFNSYEYFINTYLSPNCYIEKVEYEKNLNFVFSDQEDFSLWKSFISLALNYNNYSFTSLELNSLNETDSLAKDSKISDIPLINLIFDESILKDFIISIKTSNFLEKNKTFLNDQEKIINNNLNFIDFPRHENLSKKIFEIFKIEKNTKIMLYGPNNSGKTSFIRKFSKNELLIDVDETIEVNVFFIY